MAKVNDKDRGLSLRRTTWFKPKVGYRQLHYRIEALLGRPSVCDNPDCVQISPKRYHWSNVSGLYENDIDLWDWQRLCASCHSKFDQDNKYVPAAERKPLWLDRYQLTLQRVERG